MPLAPLWAQLELPQDATTYTPLPLISMSAHNLLYYGDNLPVMRRYLQDESVDLIYLDPPFNSDQEYNAFLPGKGGKKSASQQKAFKDTWVWDAEAEYAYQEMIDTGGTVGHALRAMRTVLENTNIMAYLVMMAPRLLEMRRILRPHGSLYLHCSPTAGHYLKMLLDAVFGPQNFRNEIVWRRTGAHSKRGRSGRYGPIHDTLFFYSKGEWHTWNTPKRPYMQGHVKHHFVQEEDGRWRTNYYGNVLTGSGKRNGFSGKVWRGFNPTDKNRHWAVPRKLLEEVDEDLSGLNVLEKLERLYELGYVTITPGDAWPLYQHYITPKDGTAVPDIWAYQPYTQGTLYETEGGIDEDVRWLSTQDRERLGYPTQKPEGLLKRILRTSSKRGDTVMDPFCGCGTTVAVAQRMKRRWIGIDIAQFAVSLTKWRLHTAYGPDAAKGYKVVGEPVSVEDAEKLAEEDRFKFQWWAVGRIMGVRVMDEKRGADCGIDGRMIFSDAPGEPDREIILSAKSGALKADDLRALAGVVTREKADMGVLVTLREPSQNMRADAAKFGTYQSSAGTKHPKIQIITVQEVLDDEGLNLPARHAIKTFKKAPVAKEPDLFED